MVLMIAGLALVGCASAPSVPANLILRDVHNNGYALTFDNGSKTLASGGSEGRIRLWALPDGKEIAGWAAHAGSLQGLQFLNHDREILSTAYDGVLARWTRDGNPLKRLVTPSPITDMAVDEAGALVITGHSDGHVRLWRLTDFALIHDLPLHRAVRSVAYHPATRQLASGGTEGSVFYWRLDEQPRALPAPPTDAQDLSFTPDGKFLMGSGWFKLFRWRLADASLIVLPTEHRGIVKSISFGRNDNRSLASISRQTDSAVYVLDAQTGDVLKRFQPHELCGTAVHLSPDGRYLASTSDDANVYLWDLRNLLPEKVFYDSGTADERR